MGEEGLHLIKNKKPGELSDIPDMKLSDEVSIHMPENQVIDLEELDEEELLIRAVAMSLEG